MHLLPSERIPFPILAAYIEQIRPIDIDFGLWSSLPNGHRVFEFHLSPALIRLRLLSKVKIVSRLPSGSLRSRGDFNREYINDDDTSGTNGRRSGLISMIKKVSYISWKNRNDESTDGQLYVEKS